MKIIHFLAALLLVGSVAVFSSCSDNDKEEEAARKQARLDSIRMADSLANVRVLDSLARVADSLLEEKNKLEAETTPTTRTSTPRSSSASSSSSGSTSQPAPVEEGPVDESKQPTDFTPGKKGDKTEASDTDFTPGKKGEVPKTGDGEVKTAEDFVPGKKK